MDNPYIGTVWHNKRHYTTHDWGMFDLSDGKGNCEALMDCMWVNWYCTWGICRLKTLKGKRALGVSDSGQTCRATVRGLEPREPPAALPLGKDLCSPSHLFGGRGRSSPCPRVEAAWKCCTGTLDWPSLQGGKGLL